MKRFLLKRKSDGLFFTAKHSWMKRDWTDDPSKAKLYTQSGHCRLSKSTYVSYRLPEEERVRIRREAFDALYEIIPIEIDLKGI